MLNSVKRASSALVVLAALLACKSQRNSSNDTPPPQQPTQPVVTAPQPNWFVHRASGTRLLAPMGWSQRKDPSWVAFSAPDRTAVLAMGSYPRGKDPSATIMKVARGLGLADIDWKGGTKGISINEIPGKTADGSCKVGGRPALYSYATLTPGGAENILVIYAVEDRAPSLRRQEAAQSLRSISRI